MYQFTTPTLNIKIPATVPVSDITALVITLLQDAIKIEKELADVQLDAAENTISFTLSQTETGGFKTGFVGIQCHILVGTSAYATNEMDVPVLGNLHGEAIS